MANKIAKEYWFRPHTAKFSWGFPMTWQGWVSFGLFIAVWLGMLMWYLSQYINDTVSASDTVLFGLAIVLDVMAIVYVSFKYGDPPKLHIRRKHGTTKS